VKETARRKLGKERLSRSGRDAPLKKCAVCLFTLPDDLVPLQGDPTRIGGRLFCVFLWLNARQELRHARWFCVSGDCCLGKLSSTSDETVHGVPRCQYSRLLLLWLLLLSSVQTESSSVTSRALDLAPAFFCAARRLGFAQILVAAKLRPSLASPDRHKDPPFLLRRLLMIHLVLIVK
jgi:hypothetical protein